MVQTKLGEGMRQAFVADITFNWQNEMPATLILANHANKFGILPFLYYYFYLFFQAFRKIKNKRGIFLPAKTISICKNLNKKWTLIFGI